MNDFKEYAPRTIRVFISSTFRDRQTRQDHRI